MAESSPPSEEAPRKKRRRRGRHPWGSRAEQDEWELHTRKGKGGGGARSKEKGFPYPFSENEVRHCGMRFGCGGGGGSVPRSPSIPTLPAGAWRSRKRASSKGGGLGRERRAHPQKRNSTKFQRSLDKVAFLSEIVFLPVWTNGPPICTVIYIFVQAFSAQ